MVKNWTQGVCYVYGRNPSIIILKIVRYTNIYTHVVYLEVNTTKHLFSRYMYVYTMLYYIWFGKSCLVGICTLNENKIELHLFSIYIQPTGYWHSCHTYLYACRNFTTNLNRDWLVMKYMRHVENSIENLLERDCGKF